MSSVDASPKKTNKASAMICYSKHCGERFVGHVNLGGHISKKHPGLSETYTLKLATRKKNELRRSKRA